MPKRLLIFTQAIDENDPVLGFFIDWVKELQIYYSSVQVITKRVGKHTLSCPVYEWNGKINLLKLIFTLQYDSVFVHMNQEYVLFAGLYWRFLGIPISLWRNHKKGNIFTTIAQLLSNNSFCTSKYAYGSKRCRIMPCGISDRFKSIQEERKDFLYVGRIAPVKQILELCEGLRGLILQGKEFHVDFYGPIDTEYFKKIEEVLDDVAFTGSFFFHGPVKFSDLPAIYASHKTIINTTPSGAFDKVIYEAAASGCSVLAISKEFGGNDDMENLLQRMDFPIMLDASNHKLWVLCRELNKYL